MMERLEVYRFYHNFMKPYRIRGKGDERGLTHGQVAGIDGEKVAWQLRSLCTQRRFFLRNQPMSPSNRELWLKGVQTALRWKADYLPSYAWA
jgi:hypothetical protein